jgi:hypothetical protein
MLRKSAHKRLLLIAGKTLETDIDTMTLETHTPYFERRDSRQAYVPPLPDKPVRRFL